MEASPTGTAQFSNALCKVTYSITMDVENTINCLGTVVSKILSYEGRIEASGTHECAYLISSHNNVFLY